MLIGVAWPRAIWVNPWRSRWTAARWKANSLHSAKLVNRMDRSVVGLHFEVTRVAREVAPKVSLGARALGERRLRCSKDHGEREPDGRQLDGAGP